MACHNQGQETDGKAAFTSKRTRRGQRSARRAANRGGARARAARGGGEGAAEGEEGGEEARRRRDERRAGGVVGVRVVITEGVQGTVGAKGLVNPHWSFTSFRNRIVLRLQNVRAQLAACSKSSLQPSGPAGGGPSTRAL